MVSVSPPTTFVGVFGVCRILQAKHLSMTSRSAFHCLANASNGLCATVRIRLGQREKLLVMLSARVILVLAPVRHRHCAQRKAQAFGQRPLPDCFAFGCQTERDRVTTMKRRQQIGKEPLPSRRGRLGSGIDYGQGRGWSPASSQWRARWICDAGPHQRTDADQEFSHDVTARVTGTSSVLGALAIRGSSQRGAYGQHAPCSQR